MADRLMRTNLSPGNCVSTGADEVDPAERLERDGSHDATLPAARSTSRDSA